MFGFANHPAAAAAEGARGGAAPAPAAVLALKGVGPAVASQLFGGGGA